VGKLECVSFPAAWEAWVNSDDHDPPHFHLEKPGEWLVKVRFMLSPPKLEVVYRMKRHAPSGRDRRRIVLAVEEHRAALYEEWLRKARVRNPGEPA
jgi:hypothetical protein